MRYTMMFGIFGMVFLAAGAYLYVRVHKMMCFFGLDMKKFQWKALNLAIVVALAAASCNLFSNTAVVILHFIAAFAVIDAVAVILRAIYGKRQQGKLFQVCRFLHQSGVVAAVVAFAIVIYGFVNMYFVVRADYTVKTDKKVQDYKIVLLTDIHYDTIQKPEVLKKAVEEINAQNPDIVLLGGDIVEEGTSKERMEEVFALLGDIRNQYGIYYVYGNHDRQPYTDSRTYTDEELEYTVLKNGIVILEDEYVEINGDFILAGRGDAAWGNVNHRPSPEEILGDVSREKFILMLDHQPVEADINGAAGVDLELSGHTHAGQIWPVGLFTELSGKLNYGEYCEGTCTVIVSSGVAGWKYTMRTGKHCEYVVVNINSTAK